MLPPIGLSPNFSTMFLSEKFSREQNSNTICRGHYFRKVWCSLLLKKYCFVLPGLKEIMDAGKLIDLVRATISFTFIIHCKRIVYLSFGVNFFNIFAANCPTAGQKCHGECSF